MIYLDDVQGKIEGTLLSTKEKSMQYEGFPITCTIYEFGYRKTTGENVVEELLVPDMTFAHRDGVREGDKIKIERLEEKVEVEISGVVTKRNFPFFGKKVDVKKVKHCYPPSKFD